MPGRLLHSAKRLAIGLAWPAAVMAVAVGAFYLFGWAVRPDLRAPVPVYSPAERAAAERGREVAPGRANHPVLWRRVSYPVQPDRAWYPRGEPAFIRELVGAGRLPPVHDRVGSEPLVLEGVDGVGRYGGTWHRVATSRSETELGLIQSKLAGASLVRFSPLGYPIVPHIAREWEVSADNRVFTFHLRRGMRWSDGHPFTADDFVYGWYDDLVYFGQQPHWMSSGGRAGRVEKVDETTIRYVFEVPNAIFLETLSLVPVGNLNPSIAQPAHYLRRFHPRDGDQALIARYMRELHVGSPTALYRRMKSYLNPELPRVTPWILRTHTPGPPFVFVRNPYYFAVDAAGNQLPYIDRVAMAVKPQEQIPLAASQGELTFQLRHVRHEDYTTLMEHRQAGGYDVRHWYPASRSSYTVFPNLNRRVDPSRPATRWKHDLLNQAAFRQALSLAINRGEIIRAEMSGLSEPAQIDPGPDSPFHSPELFKAFVEHDPARAGALLDSLGLTVRDGEGMRTFPDGSRMTFFLHVTDFTGSGPAELLIGDWAGVGLRVILREQARSLFQAQQTALEHDLTVWTSESEYIPLVQPRNFVPTGLHSFYAAGFGNWFVYGGIHGNSGVAHRPGAVEPPPGHPLRKAMELYVLALQTPELDRQVALFAQIQQIAAENVWTISIGTSPPQPVVVKRGLQNVPRNAVVSSNFSSPSNAGVETWWLEEPLQSPGMTAQIQREMVETVPEPRVLAAAEQAGGVEEVETVPMRRPGPRRGLVGWLVWSVIGAGLVLIGLRHPFVGRRLLIMVPTLAVMSVLIFTIIQLPPGNFVTARILELEMSGESGNQQLARDLEEQFHLGAPCWERYARWMGLYWFLGFDPADRGLLQGDLGRSMEDGRLVNDIVGDRILLSVAIAVGTVVLTWCLALPLGIYSAVRRYSVGDHLLTLGGFLGVCIPNFLLALIVIHVAQHWFGVRVAGLFSPEYAIQPGWSWGKVADLLKHLWVPVVVLGLGGTAGMMRVMRGNLLDELRQPYVLAARARGMRPLRLLLKYPVRLALSPFVSAVGELFPQLVSGGAIVSMVLALPTIGPLQLSALMAEDMYLAGSMLMVLSLLGVLGTLVSDLLLLALDPRIRMEGGRG